MALDDFRVGDSPISGQGIFAVRDIQARTAIGVFTGREIAAPNQHSVFLDGRHIEPDSPLRYLNHSCMPNAAFEGRMLVADRTIAAGDEITIDYRRTEPELSAGFRCHCGSPRCEGELGGQGSGPETRGR